MPTLEQQLARNRQVAEAIEGLLRVVETDTATYLEAADHLVALAAGSLQ